MGRPRRRRHGVPHADHGGDAHWSAPKSVQRPEGVTVHESGHQFLYGPVASNEFEEAWLDEGFNTYMMRPSRRRGLRPATASSSRSSACTSLSGSTSTIPSTPTGVTSRSPTGTSSPPTPGGSATGSPTARTSTRRRRSRWRRSSGSSARRRWTARLRLYADRWRFRHPTTRDFIAAVNESTGQDWRWFFDRTFFSSGIVDYAVEEAVSEPAKPPRGLFEEDGKLVELGPPGARRRRGATTAS